jgi:hypothetical protein
LTGYQKALKLLPSKTENLKPGSIIFLNNSPGEIRLRGESGRKTNDQTKEKGENQSVT